MDRGIGEAGAVEPERGRDPDQDQGAVSDRPRTVRLVSLLLVLLVGLLGVAVVLTRVLRDDLVLAWARSDDTAGPLVAAGGLPALEESSVAVPSFPMMALTTFAVFGTLVAVLLAFLRQGYGWARVALSATVVFLGCVAAFGLGVGLLPLVVVLAASLVVDAVLLVLLWHRDTTTFLRRRAFLA